MDQAYFSVVLFGVSETETAAIRRVFRLSESRARVYNVSQLNQRDVAVDILLVDPTRVARAQTLAFSCPVVMLDDSSSPMGSSRAPSAPKQVGWDDVSLAGGVFSLPRPLIASRVLRVLDQVTVDELNYVPELEVGNGGNNVTPADKALLERALKSNASSVASELATSGGVAQSLKALVVDDSLLVRKQMELIFRSTGIRTEFSASGEEALERLRYEAFDVIFLDVMMPGMDGFQTCKAIRREIQPLPKVVLLTSKTSRIHKARGALSGADAYLTKPASVKTLAAKLKELFPPRSAASAPALVPTSAPASVFVPSVQHSRTQFKPMPLGPTTRL